MFTEEIIRITVLVSKSNFLHCCHAMPIPASFWKNACLLLQSMIVNRHHQHISKRKDKKSEAACSSINPILCAIQKLIWVFLFKDVELHCITRIPFWNPFPLFTFICWNQNLQLPEILFPSELRLHKGHCTYYAARIVVSLNFQWKLHE